MVPHVESSECSTLITWNVQICQKFLGSSVQTWPQSDHPRSWLWQLHLDTERLYQYGSGAKEEASLKTLVQLLLAQFKIFKEMQRHVLHWMSAAEYKNMNASYLLEYLVGMARPYLFVQPCFGCMAKCEQWLPGYQLPRWSKTSTAASSACAAATCEMWIRPCSNGSLASNSPGFSPSMISMPG